MVHYEHIWYSFYSLFGFAIFFVLFAFLFCYYPHKVAWIVFSCFHKNNFNTNLLLFWLLNRVDNTNFRVVERSQTCFIFSNWIGFTAFFIFISSLSLFFFTIFLTIVTLVFYPLLLYNSLWHCHLLIMSLEPCSTNLVLRIYENIKSAEFANIWYN